MRIIQKYKSIIAYLFFGVCTTAVNLIVYFLCARWINLSTGFSTVVAWLLAVIFAFLTNKVWVFESKSWERKLLIKELGSFFICRAASGVADLIIMLITVDILDWNELMMKLFSNTLVIILNYVASKLFVFKKPDRE